MLRPEPCARPSSGIAAEHEDGAIQPFHQTAGDNAEHAAVPVFGVVDQRGGRGVDFHVFADFADFELPPVAALRFDREVAGRALARAPGRW